MRSQQEQIVSLQAFTNYTHTKRDTVWPHTSITLPFLCSRSKHPLCATAAYRICMHSDRGTLKGAGPPRAAVCLGVTRCYISRLLELGYTIKQHRHTPRGSQISESLMVSYCSGLICSRARVSSYIIRGKSIRDEARLRMFGDSHLLWEHRAWLLFQAWKWRSRYEHTCTVLFLHRPRPSRTRAGVTQLSPVSTAKHPHR